MNKITKFKFVFKRYKMPDTATCAIIIDGSCCNNDRYEAYAKAIGEYLNFYNMEPTETLNAIKALISEDVEISITSKIKIGDDDDDEDVK